MKRFSRARATLSASLLALGLIAGLAWAATVEPLEILTRSGVRVFEVELAITDDERAKGLMFRRELPEGRGMLFDFKSDQMVAMWMKNTFVSLDMIFIRADGRIAHIAESTTPQSEAIISSARPGARRAGSGGRHRKKARHPARRQGRAPLVFRALAEAALAPCRASP